MPRPQALNFKYAKPDVDVWAAAATLYYLLTGHTPRDFLQGSDPWRTVWFNDPVPILERLVSIPTSLAQVIDEALVDDPEIAFKTIASFRTALEEAI